MIYMCTKNKFNPLTHLRDIEVHWQMNRWKDIQSDSYIPRPKLRLRGYKYSINLINLGRWSRKQRETSKSSSMNGGSESLSMKLWTVICWWLFMWSSSYDLNFTKNCLIKNHVRTNRPENYMYLIHRMKGHKGIWWKPVTML